MEQVNYTSYRTFEPPMYKTNLKWH